MKGGVIGIVCLLGMASAAVAAEKGDSPWQEQTQSWLKLQTEGNHASPTPQAVTPAERERSMQRWLDSYKHEIPDFFEQKKTAVLQGNYLLGSPSPAAASMHYPATGPGPKAGVASPTSWLLQRTALSENKKPGISAGFLILADQAQGTSLSSSSLSRTAPLSALVANNA